MPVLAGRRRHCSWRGGEGAFDFGDPCYGGRERRSRRALRRMAAGRREWRAGRVKCPAKRGCSSMAEQKLPKLTTRVRFPSPAPPLPAPAPPMTFAARIVRWQRRHGRHDLPWQGTRDAYRVWLSEIMLQQTQVATVIPYLRALPRALSRRAPRSPRPPRTTCWRSGAAWATTPGPATCTAPRSAVVERFGGRFPVAFDDLADACPAWAAPRPAAIAAFAAGERRAILDGNVKRVLARHAGIGGDPSTSAVQARLWAEAEARLPAKRHRGLHAGHDGSWCSALPRASPRCVECPVAADCVARIEDRIEELPGKRRRAVAKRKRIAMLVVLSRGEVLLEKRPRPRESGAASGHCRRSRSMPTRSAPRRSSGWWPRRSRSSKPSSTPSRTSRSRSSRGASRHARPRRSPPSTARLAAAFGPRRRGTTRTGSQADKWGQVSF